MQLVNLEQDIDELCVDNTGDQYRNFGNEHVFHRLIPTFHNF